MKGATPSRRWLGNLLAIALSETRTETGWDLDEAAAIVVAADRQNRARHRRGGVVRARTGGQIDNAKRLAAVLETVARRRRVSPDSLLEHSRMSAVVQVRHEAWHEMRQLDPPASYPAIAAYFGMASHQTIWHGVRTYEKRIAAAAKR